MSEGKKDDESKPNCDLVLGDFGLALLEVSRVGTRGAAKYGDSNWLSVENGQQRYSSAAQRHWLMSKYELLDNETHLLHAAHHAWNALAVLELMMRERRRTSTTWCGP